MKNFLRLLLSLALPLAVGAVAGMFTASAVPGWYATLSRPSFSPPNWVFGPVWTTLYILMGLSFYMIWRSSPGPMKRQAVIVYLIQLGLNFLWSFLFFYFQMIGWALAEIVALWAAIAAMLFLFYRIRPAAAWLNMPYFLWVTFATVLTAGYYLLN